MLKQNRFFIPGIIAVVILVAVVAGYFLALPIGDELPASVHIEPQQAQQGSEVTADSTFTLQTAFSVKEEDIRSMVTVEPALQYELKGGGKSWSLEPHLPLADNTVYTFQVHNQEGRVIQSFAFQTKSDLLIHDTYPMDGEGYVDVQTGIEVRFNKTGVDLSKGFEILPPVAGHFETRDYTARFIPDKPLAPDSIYRVTIASGLVSADGSALQDGLEFSFETAPDQDDESAWNALELSGDFSVTLLPGDSGVVPMRGGESAANGEYTMTLHKFPGIRAYTEALRARESYLDSLYGKKEPYRITTDGLETVMEAAGKLIGSRDTVLGAPLPDDLSEGYYVFTLSGKDPSGNEQFVQQMIQAVNLSVYSQSVSGDSLFWVNDPVSGGPVGGARLELEDVKSGEKQSGEFQSDGIARLMTGGWESVYATIVRDETPLWFGRVALGETPEEHPLSEDYYTALYTDRELYQPGDEIHFWGVVRPRRITADLPENVVVRLKTEWPESTMSQMEAAVGSDGTFSGTLSPSQLKKGAYRFSVENADGGQYQSRYLEITEYTKPAYLLELSTDKDAYYFGDTVQFNVAASYFDGTPASGAKLQLNCDAAEGLSERELTLDADGQATVTGRLNPPRGKDGKVAPWEPQAIRWSVTSADAQAANVFQSASFTALPSRIAAELEELGPGVLKISLAVLDDTKLGAGDAIQTSFESLKGVPADIPATLIVHKITFRQEQTGSYYDYVNKKNVPTYRTQREETVENTIQVKPVAGMAVIEDLPYTEENGETIYWYELRFAGGVYGDVMEMISHASPLRYADTQKSYAFFPEEGWRDYETNAGDPIRLGLYENGIPVTNNGRVLYTAVQRQILTSDTYEQDSAELTLTEPYLPNFWMAGAYFDGRHIYPINRTNVRYRYDDRTLLVKAAPDKETYQPGDQVQLSLSITDPEGNAVNGAAAVGIVDEAVFALREQDVDLAGQMFGAVYYPSIVTSVSYSSQNDREAMDGGLLMEAAADKAFPNTAGGSGGDAAIRSQFADTASFQVVEVSGGKADLTFTMPDNITSWRVTAAAVGTDMVAGSGVSEAVSTLPFYLREICSDTYLTGDDIALSVLASGSAVQGFEGDVGYTAALYNAAGEEVARQNGKASPGKRVSFNFGKQARGAYKAVITGEMGDLKDGVARSFAVADSGLLVPALETVPLPELGGVESGRYPVTVTIFDEQAKPRIDVLSFLSSHSGQRTEQLAAAYRAQVLYNELLPPEQRQVIYRDSRLDDIQSDGGVKTLPNSGPDIAVTARMLFGAPELIHTGEAAAYLRKSLQDASITPQQRIMAYAGLAAAKEPVLLDLDRLREQEAETLDAAGKLYLGAAYAVLGNFDTARELYAAYEKSANWENGMCYLDGSGTEESRIETTAAALLLTSLISHEDMAGYQQYFLVQDNERSRLDASPYFLELLASVRSASPDSHSGGRFTYVDANKESQEINLAGKGVYAVLMDGETLANAKFKALSGKLYASVSVLRPIRDESTSSGGVTVTKTYEPIGTEELSVGGRVKVTVKITFDDSAAYGAYNLTDAIPSGLRWLPASDWEIAPRQEALWASVDNEGQTIRAAIYRNRPGQDVEPLDGGIVPRAPSPLTAQYTAIKSAEEIESEMRQGDTPEEKEPAGSSQDAAPEAAEPSEEPPEADDAGSPSQGASPETADTADVLPEVLPADTSGDIEGTERDTAQELPDEEPVEAPVRDTAKPIPNTSPAEETPANPNEYIITYYLSAALPGTFITESAYITPGAGGIAAQTERGQIVVSEEK